MGHLLFFAFVLLLTYVSVSIIGWVLSLPSKVAQWYYNNFYKPKGK